MLTATIAFAGTPARADVVLDGSELLPMSSVSDVLVVSDRSELVLAGWEYGARTLGPLFFAPPLETAQRLWELARNGQMFSDILATMRVAVAGFAIAGIIGAILPFLLRRSPRATEAVEPTILFTMGIPKYALAPWLILWFGIGDMPKLVVVALVVFYIVFQLVLKNGIPFFAITLLAALQAIPRDLYEAAAIDGANALQRFWSITLPFLAPTMAITILLRTVWIANFADLIIVMTSGGPADRTQIVASYIFPQAFRRLDFGYASAIALVLLLLLMAYSLLIVLLRQTMLRRA